MNEQLLVREFMEAIRERAERDYRGRLQQAFVAWFIEAEFGRVEWAFTDDAGDGGIDAVVWRRGERPSVVLIQSKFSERLGRSLVSTSAYREFDAVIEAFRGNDEAFESFLKLVREDVRRTYRKAQQSLGENGWLTAKNGFRFITTLKPRSKYENARIPDSSYRYDRQILDLYLQYRKGHTPRANDLHLRVDDKLPYRDPKRGVTSYLLNARVSDFREYFEANDVARLVARNIRYNLAGRIGKEIRETYESEPTNFWYVHNGITIICDDYVEKDQTATLENPSVVNGAQTLYAIAASHRRASPALVATRVIVRHDHGVSHEDDAWVQKIIKGVNTQNRVRNQDFRSNEPEQLELQHLFRDQRVFYERKRGEWRENRNDPRFRKFSRTSMRTIGMALTAVSEDDGGGVALVKRGVEAIFEKRNYEKLFPKRSLMSRRFERIYLAYRVTKFLRRYAYSADEFRKQRHAFWTLVWLFYKGLTAENYFFSNATVASIREGFDRFERRGLAGMRAKAAAKGLRRSIWAAWRKARRVDPERLTANNFFKSKAAHRKVLQLAFPKHRKALARLGEALEA